MFGDKLRHMLMEQIFGCSKILLVAENGRLGMNILWGRLEYNGETIRKDGWRLRISRTQGGEIQKKWKIRKLSDHSVFSSDGSSNAKTWK